jgi:hypothetical protein
LGYGWVRVGIGLGYGWEMDGIVAHSFIEGDVVFSWISAVQQAAYTPGYLQNFGGCWLASVRAGAMITGPSSIPLSGMPQLLKSINGSLLILVMDMEVSRQHEDLGVFLANAPLRTLKRYVDNGSLYFRVCKVGEGVFVPPNYCAIIVGLQRKEDGDELNAFLIQPWLNDIMNKNAFTEEKTRRCYVATGITMESISRMAGFKALSGFSKLAKQP